MSAWIQLLRKELRLGRSYFIGVIIFMMILTVIGIGFALYYPIGIVSMMFMVGSPLLVFYLLVFLIVSLANEKHSFSIWMQMPLPGWSLFAAKLLAGLIYLLLTGLAAMLLTLLVFQFDGGLSVVELAPHEHRGQDFETGQMLLQFLHEHYFLMAFTSIPVILGASMLLAAGYLIFFISKEVLQRWFGKWSILAGVIIVILVLHLYDRLEFWGVKQLFSWGHIPFLFPSQSEADEYGVQLGMNHIYHDSLSIGYFIFDILVLSIVVLLSGWLLDRKAEVR